MAKRVTKKQTATPVVYDEANARRRLRDKYIHRLRVVEDKYGIVYSEITKDKVRKKPLSTEELRRLAYESYRRFPTKNGVKAFTNFVVRDRLTVAEIALKRKIALPTDPTTKKPKKVTKISFDEANRLIKGELDKTFKSKERVSTMRKRLNEALAQAKTYVKTSDSTIRSLRIELARNPNFSFDNLQGKLDKGLSAKIANEYMIWFGKTLDAREAVEGWINLDIGEVIGEPVVLVKPDETGDRNILLYALQDSLKSLKEIYEDVKSGGDGGLIWKIDNHAGKGGAAFVIIEGQITEYINALDDVFVTRAVKALGQSNLGDFTAYDSELTVKNIYEQVDFDKGAEVFDIVEYYKKFIQSLIMKYIDYYISKVESQTGKKFNRNLYPTLLDKEDIRLYKKAVEAYERDDKEKEERIGYFEE